jgi:hypothetical protein
VTRLDEYSLFGCVFTLGHIFGVLFPPVKDDVLILMGWATFRAIFSQTYLVTLLVSEALTCLLRALS